MQRSKSWRDMKPEVIVIPMSKSPPRKGRRAELEERLKSPARRSPGEGSPTSAERLRLAEERREQLRTERLDQLAKRHSDIEQKRETARAEAAAHQEQMSTSLVSRMEEASERRDDRLMRVAASAGK